MGLSLMMHRTGLLFFFFLSAVYIDRFAAAFGSSAGKEVARV